MVDPKDERNRWIEELFGSLNYSPPLWLKRMRERALPAIQGGFADSSSWYSDNKPLVARVSLAMIAVGLGVYGGIHWYRNLPKPAEITISIAAPRAMPLKEKAKPNPLLVQFSASAAPLELVGEPVSSGVTLSPPHRGSWTWTSDRALKFVPESDWPPGRRFALEFSRDFFPEHLVPSAYKHEFHSAAFSVSIKQADFNQDPTDPALKRVVATLAFSHPVDPITLQERIFLQMGGKTQQSFFGFGKKSFPFSVSYDEFKGEAYIHSDRIKIGNKEITMRVIVEEGVASSRKGEPFKQKIERSVSIPGIYTIFRIQNSQLTVVRNSEYVPEQVLVLGLTTGALESEIANSLEVYLLPVHKPAIQGQPLQHNYYWNDVRRIGPEVLAASKRLVLSPLPTDREFATVHSYRYKADPNRFIYIRIKKGVEAFGGYKLAETYHSLNRVPQYPKEVKVMHTGSLISLQGDKRIRILSRGVPGVRFEVSRVRAGQVNHFVSQSHGNFSNPAFYGRFQLDNMTDRFEQVRSFSDPDPTATNYASLNLGELLAQSGHPRGLFFLNVQAWDPIHKHASGPKDSRAILITDLGIIVKEELGGSRAIFIQSLQSGKPVMNADVEVLGVNGEPIAFGKSGAFGRVNIQSLSGYSREKTPIAIIARKGSDLSFIPYHRGDRYLDMSRFDTGGVRSHSLREGLQAYLFSDRGIYRPGDEFRVGLIVKGTDWRRNLQGIPLEATITDARGLEVHKQRFRLSEAAFEDFKYRTAETSPTGAWRFSLYIVKDDRRFSLLDSVQLRLEEFLPDRLKIETRFSTSDSGGWVSPQDLKGLVSLKNLYGTAAAGNTVRAKIALSPTRPVFSRYEGFLFADPNRNATPHNEALPPGKTDADGSAFFEFNLKRFDKAIYRLRFYAEGFEASGGRSVASESGILVSDREYLLGFNPGGRLDYVHKGSTRAVRLVAVGPNLDSIPVPALRMHIYERKHVSALKRQSNGTFRYESVIKEREISAKTLTIGAKGINTPLLTNEPGEFRVSIREEGGGEQLKFTYTVVGDANVSRSLEKATQLQIRLSKTDFKPGEEIEFQFTAPYAGSGLITIERERVYAHKWFHSDETSGVQRIRLPKDLEGNGYLNVTFVRASDSPEIYMKPLSYAAAPFTVSRGERMIPVKLEISEEARPGEAYRIRFKTDRKSKIVVFAIDEGILQVAGYHTPAPLDKFLAKRALEVRTAQILDLIMPDYSAIPGLKAPGGGGFAAIGKNLNPFKRRRAVPVAYWSGIIDSGDQWQELTYEVPDHFNGTLRVMAVAVSKDAIGVGEAKGLIRAPFVITPQVPLFLAPGDRCTVTAAILNNAKGSGKEPTIDFNLSLNSRRLRIIGKKSQTLVIPEGKEQSVKFEIEALRNLGPADLTFKASWGEELSRARIGMSVRPPVPYRTTVTSGRFKKGTSNTKIERRLYPQYRELKASVSTLPIALAHGLSSYLKHYPFGCTEQLVSRAFAALVLRRKPAFGYGTKKADESLAKALRILRARQNAQGAFGFWAANSHVSPFHAVYAMHFLTELKDEGRLIGQDVMRRGQSYLDRLGARRPQSLAQARDSAYALYVLTRNGQVRTRAIQALHQRLKSGQFENWESDLTAAYLAASYAQLHMRSKANRLNGGLKLGETQESDYGNFYDGLRRDSQLLYLWSKHFPDRLKRLRGDELDSMAGHIKAGSYNTITSAYTILAFDAYGDAVGDPGKQNVAISQELQGGESAIIPLPQGLHPTFDFSDQANSLTVKNSGPHSVYFQVTQAGFDDSPPTTAVKQKIEIHRELRTEAGEQTTTAHTGEALTVVLRIRSLDGRSYSNSAIVDLLPGGFEPVRNPENPAYTGARLAIQGSSFRPQHEDIREDRVVLFGTITERVQEYRYKIRAVNAGKFSTPPAYAESMYDRSVQARSLPSSITVEPAK